MSTPGNMRLAFVIEAIDKATATVTRINKTIDRVTEPVRRVRAATQALKRESRFEQVQAAWANLGARGQGLLDWGRNVAGMLTTMGFAAAGAAWGLKRVIDQVDSSADQAKKLGITVSAFERVGYALQLNGGQADDAGQALQFLSQNMVEAINGSKEAAVWFARAGIPLERLRTMNVVQVMEAIADQFAAVGDAGQNASKKIALTRALMGRGGAELVQMLNQGSAGLRRFYAEADRLGAVIDQGTADSMGDFNDNFDRMSFSVRGAMRAIAGAALPVLDDLVRRTTQWTVANREVIASGVAQFVERVLPRLPAFATSVMQIVGALAALVAIADRVAQAMGGWETVMAVLAGVILGKGLLAVTALTTAAWGLGAALMATPFGWFAVGAAALAAAGGLIYAKWEPIKAFFEGLWETLKGVFSAFGRVTAKPAEGAPSIYAGADEWARYRAGQALPTAMVGALSGKQDLGGTLRIVLDQDGRARVGEVRTAPGSPLNFDVYSGPSMAGP